MSEQHFQESIDTFKIKFEGENSIDAELFARTINNTVELVKASAKAINPDAFLRLEIKATQDGSFETIIDAVVKYKDNLFNVGNLAKDITEGFLSFLQIKQLLGSKTAKNVINKGNKTTIISQEDRQITAPQNIYNYYISGNVDNIISNAANDLKNGNRPVVIETGNKNLRLTKEDYDNMSIPIVEKNKSIVSKENTEIIRECELTIKKPDLIGNSRWEVIFAGRPINVKIDDKVFITQIKEGKIKISGGYRLITDLNICTETDSEYNTINVDYTVIKIHGIKDREEQLTFF